MLRCTSKQENNEACILKSLIFLVPWLLNRQNTETPLTSEICQQFKTSTVLICAISSGA